MSAHVHPTAIPPVTLTGPQDAPRDILPNRAHLARLMQVWRSAGWPCRDPIEIDLIAAGWVTLAHDEAGRETLRLTEAGIGLLAASRQRNLRANSRHDRLARRVARHLAEAGRVVWLEMMLRALVQPESPDRQDAASDAEGPATALAAHEPVADLGELGAPGLWAPGEPGCDAALEAAAAQARMRREQPKGIWRMARPDVFSVRNTTVEAYLQPVVHEIKVSRADLLSDLRHAAKRESYRWLCSACYYVFPAGIAKPNEIPEAFGVWVLHGDIEDGRLEQLRPARHNPCRLPFAVWMALAKATPLRLDPDESQGMLGDPGQGDPSGAAADGHA